MSRLDGKVAVVTGSTQSLGAAIARLFAERGAAGLVTCGRSVERGEAGAVSIQAQTGVRTVFVRSDQGKVEDCRLVIATADREFGRLDVLVNAAAIADRGNILEHFPTRWSHLVGSIARRNKELEHYSRANWLGKCSRHDPRPVRHDVRGQRPWTVLPDAGRDSADAAR